MLPVWPIEGVLLQIKKKRVGEPLGLTQIAR